MTKRLLETLQGKPHWPPPFWLMRQAGRYLPEYRASRADAGSFLDLCYSPDFAVEVTLQPLRRYAMDAAILFSDILVVPHGLGMHLEFREGEGPCLDPLKSRSDIAKLDTRRMHGKLAPVYETVNRLATAIPQGTTLIGFAGAPWTVATYMVEGGSSRDFTKAKKWAYERPEDFQALIDLLVTATGEYLLAQIDKGADCVQLFDSWAGVLPDDQFRRWVIAPAKAIVQRLKKERPGVPVIGFPRGAGILYEEFARETGVDAVSLDTTVPLAWAAKTLEPICCVQGNLDPLLLVAGGQTMEKAIRRILDGFKGGRFIFNLGHGIVPETPPEHVARLAELVRSGG